MIVTSSACALALFMVCYSFKASAAKVFGSLEPQYIVPGQLLEVPMTLSRQEGLRLQVKLQRAPEGLLLKVNTAGEFVIQWKTPADLPLESLVVIAASDVDSGKDIDVRHLLIRNAQDFQPITHVAQALATEEDTLAQDTLAPNFSQTGVPPLAASAALPEVLIQKVSNQIVSTGRTVSLSIVATSSDGVQPIVEVDRLPRNASFELRSNGSYLLFWPTGDPDQGEHLFRFTARHASESSVTDTRDVMIVVGDPVRSKTLPQELR